MNDLREMFRPRLVATGRERMQRAFALLDDPANASAVEAELHGLAGDAGLIGFKDLALAARTAEQLARTAAADADARVFARCARAVRAVARLVEALDTQDDAASSDAPPPGATASGVLALVIDDSDIAREQLTAALTGAGMQVCSADSVDHALAVLVDHAPHIVLADVNMPGMVDGACATLRTAAHGAPVLLVSALTEGELSERVARAGADGYASKHRGPAAIVSRVREALRERAE